MNNILCVLKNICMNLCFSSLAHNLFLNYQTFLFVFKDLFIYYMLVHCSCLQTPQKRASDLITDGCEPPCGCWELNSGPLEGQSVLLTAEPSRQPIYSVLIVNCSYLDPVCLYGKTLPSHRSLKVISVRVGKLNM